MPPEQFQKGGKIAFNADLWSFGVTLFELFTGDLPFGRQQHKGDTGRIIYNILNEDVPDSVNNIAEPYRSLIKTCMVKDREKRPKAAQEILDILSGKKDVTKPVSPATQVISKTNFTETINGVPLKMVFVQGGSFMMGATPEQGDDARGDEKPVHHVSLDSFYIGKYPVTQGLWKAVMGANFVSYNQGGDLPLDSVSWDDAQTFIQKLNQLTGIVFRLPTEAEWEYAARGGANSRGYKYAGSDKLNDVGWFRYNSGSKTIKGGIANLIKRDWWWKLLDWCGFEAILTREPQPVGLKKSNELGIYDMSGNVQEWCEDDWHDNYNGAPTDGRAWIDNPRGYKRVLRGGSWYFLSRYCRVSFRVWNSPVCGPLNDGFRLAQDF
jgi:eukaryotic-like serine/threonine-protein kinase